MAAVNATAEQARLLEEEVERSCEISKISGVNAFEALADHDEKLHNLIFEVADNALLTKAYKSTHCFLHLYRLHFIRDVPVDFQDTLDEHDQIVKAIQDKSADQARNAMIDHIENARKRFQYPAI